MSRIRGRDTGPEIYVRRGLHARGLRFRLHGPNLPGHPDLVLARYRAVIMVHGCFWHAHPGCRLAARPRTNTAFWEGKLAANRERDVRVRERIEDLGWRVLTVWECAIRADQRRSESELLPAIALWLRSGGASRDMEVLEGGGTCSP